MSELKLDGPVSIQLILGLTLPEVSDAELERIRAAAPPGSSVRLAHGIREAIETAADVDIILGFIPEVLFEAAPRLRWVHAIASGIDMFLYPAMRDSDVVLSSEKGLVGDTVEDIQGLLDEYAQAEEQRFSQHKEQIERQERELLHQLRISGSAVGDINLEASETWKRSSLELSSRFNERMETLKTKLMDSF